MITMKIIHQMAPTKGRFRKRKIHKNNGTEKTVPLFFMLEQLLNKYN